MKKKYIFVIFSIILFFAVSLPVTKAYSSISEIKTFSLSESDKLSVISIDVSKQTKVTPYFQSKENCMILEFSDSIISNKLENNAIAGRDIKLAYIRPEVSLCKKNNRNEKKVIAKIFLKKEILPSVKKSNNKVIVKLCYKEKETNNKKVSYPKLHNTLLHPNEEKYTPVCINIEGASFKSVTSKLASQAGIELRFKGNFPETFSINLQSENPFNALEFIADKTNTKFYRENKIWYMEGGV